MCAVAYFQIYANVDESDTGGAHARVYTSVRVYVVVCVRAGNVVSNGLEFETSTLWRNERNRGRAWVSGMTKKKKTTILFYQKKKNMKKRMNERDMSQRSV